MLRSYLSTYEQFLTNLDYDAIDPLILNYGGAIDKSLAEVLVLLDDMRSRDHSRCTKGRRGIKGRKKVHEVNGTSRNDVTLIWDDKATQEYVGRRADCIWIVSTTFACLVV